MTTHPPKESSILLELRGISKRFGVTQALDEASLTIFSGEIHALLGENGAGKSTLVSIAAGLLRDEGGTLRLGGRERGAPVGTRSAPGRGRPRPPALFPRRGGDGRRQPRAPRPGRHPFVEPPVGPAPGGSGASPGAYDLDLGEIPMRSSPDLPVGTRQRIGIAGLLAGRSGAVLILDEPTAVLAPARSHWRSSARSGVVPTPGHAVVLITHRLAEVFEAADRLTLLARGKTVKSCLVSETTANEIGNLLLGSAEKSEDLLLSGGCLAAADSGKRVSLDRTLSRARKARRTAVADP